MEFQAVQLSVQQLAEHLGCAPGEIDAQGLHELNLDIRTLVHKWGKNIREALIYVDYREQRPYAFTPLLKSKADQLRRSLEENQ